MHAVLAATYQNSICECDITEMQILVHSFPVLGVSDVKELVCRQGNCKACGIEFDI